MSSTENLEERPELSPEAMAALREFYAERDRQQTQFVELKAQTTDKGHTDGGRPGTISMEAFTEDWNASQFWYDDETATVLAEQLLDGATQDSGIAVVSAPSVFVKLKQLMADGKHDTQPAVWLLEFDRRFDILPGFVYYDFNRPLQLPDHLKGQCDRIICDPPFLSDDCQTKAAMTVNWLSRQAPRPSRSGAGSASASASSTADRSSLRLITCTGETMTDLVTARLYRGRGVRTTTFRPRHAKGLSNEFRCFANFECPAWTWQS